MLGETVAASVGRLSAKIASPMAGRRKTLLAACALISIVMVIGCYIRRKNNWDEIAYTGAAISWSVRSAKEVHTLTYGYVVQATTHKSFNRLVNGPPNSTYRQAVYHHAGDLERQLRFYSVKPLYIALIWIGWNLGLNPVRAAAGVSALAAGCLGFIVGWILVDELGAVGVVLFPAVLLGARIDAVGTLATPDALSALIVFSGLWLMRRRERSASHLALLLLLLGVWTRVDNVILLLLLCGTLTLAFLFRRTDAKVSKVTPAMYSMAGIATWIGIDRIARGFSWKTLIHESFVQYAIAPWNSIFSWKDYETALRFGIHSFLGNLSLPAMLLLGVVILLYCANGAGANVRRDTCLLSAGLLCIIAHLLLFPMANFRYFEPIYVFIITLGVVYLPEAIAAERLRAEAGRA